MAGVPPTAVILDLVNSLQSNSFSAMENSVQNIIADGYPVPSIISLLFDYVAKDQNASDLTKAELSIKIAETDKNLVDGASELLQLMNVCCVAMRWFASDTNKKNGPVCY